MEPVDKAVSPGPPPLVDAEPLLENEEEMCVDECRICRGEATPEAPLAAPCRCSGSMRFVHQSCLLQWIQLSNARRCEVR